MAAASVNIHFSRAGGIYRASKKELYDIYLFEEQGTSEGFEWFQIYFIWFWVEPLVIKINLESFRTFLLLLKK